MVILMHGIFASKDFIPMPSLAKGLAREGIASIRFDFNGHGRSDGRMQDMTVEKEIGLLGHSQGGAVASMAAGRLAEAPAGVVLIAPGSVLLLHGSEDSIVPLWCSEKYLETYGDNAELKVIDEENHMITKRRKQIVAETVAFFKTLFSK